MSSGVLLVVVFALPAVVVQARVSEQQAAAQVHKAITLNRIVPGLVQGFTNQPQYLSSDIENPVPPQATNDAITGILGVAAAQANALASAGNYSTRIAAVTADCPSGGSYQIQGTPGAVYQVFITFSACVYQAGADIQVDGPMSIRLRTPAANPSQLSTLAGVRFGTDSQPLVIETRLYTTPPAVGRRIANYAVTGAFLRRYPFGSGIVTGDYRISVDGTLSGSGQFLIGNDEETLHTSTEKVVAQNIATSGSWSYDTVTGYQDTDDKMECGKLTVDDALDGTPTGSLAFAFDDLRLVNAPAIGASQVRIDGKAFVGYGPQAEPSCVSGPVQARTLATLIDNGSFFTSGQLTVDDDIQVSIDTTTFPSAQMRVRHALFTFVDSGALEAAGGCFH